MQREHRVIVICGVRSSGYAVRVQSLQETVWRESYMTDIKRSEGVTFASLNEGGEFEYNLMHSYEKFLQYVV